MSAMAFHVLTGPSGPVPLAGQQPSQLFDLVRKRDEGQMFVRLVALFRDNDPLEGKAPTLQIKAGTGTILTSVEANASWVSVRDADDNVVGSATCQRLKNDIFLLTISDMAENSGPWRLRIQNNDAEALRFLGFTAPDPDDTRQPWMVLGGADNGGPVFGLSNQGSRLRDIEVRNLGTEPLRYSTGLDRSEIARQ
jgi:hypothetical protein